MNRRERRASAQISKDASTPGALYADAVGHLNAQRYLDAQICCQRALTLDAGNADILHLMGFINLQQEQYDVAIAWIARAIQQGSPKPIYLWSLGSALQSQGRHEEALKAFDKAVQLK